MGIVRLLVIASSVIYYILGAIFVIAGLFTSNMFAVAYIVLGVIYVCMSYYIARIKRRLDQGDKEGVRDDLSFIAFLSFLFLNLIVGIILFVAYYKLKKEEATSTDNNLTFK